MNNKSKDAVNLQTFKLMLSSIASRRRYFVKASIFFTIQAILLYSITPFIISSIIAELAADTTFLNDNILQLLVCALIATVFTGGVINRMGFYAYSRLRARTREDLEAEAADGMLKKDHTFFANQKIGSLTSNYIGYVEGHTAITDSIFLDTLPLIASYTASLVIITFLAPYLLPVLLVLTLSFTVHALYSFRKRTYLRIERKKQVSSIRGYVADVIGNSMLVKVFGREEFEIDEIKKRSKSIGRLFDEESLIMANDSLGRISLLYGFQIMTIVCVILLFQYSGLSLTIMIFVITYLIKTANDIFRVGPIIRTFEQAMLDATPMIEILESDGHIKDLDNARELSVSKARLEFKDVSFDYRDNDDNIKVFKNLSFCIEQGERVGLVGPSGGGKSTITKLLLRFLDIQEGQILIDNQSISQVTQTSLRSNIAYVPQEPFLFHRSLFENIAYGKNGNTEVPEVRKVAERANALEFIDELPHGMDTIVGERGIKLSGGQKQRVAIARAILKDAPILLLDEATSALDSESEQLVQTALNELMKDRTSLVIAHRLSTIQKMDRIIVLDKGTIIEQGTHQELLNKNGLYARLWARQSGGFIEE